MRFLPNALAGTVVLSVATAGGEALTDVGESAAIADGPAMSFRDAAAASGIAFRLEHHASDDKRLAETMPGGLAAFDYNGDGLIDLYFPNGATLQRS